MNHKGTKSIETNRLILRKFRNDDSENMFSNFANDQNVTRYFSWQTHNNIKDSEDIINLWIANYVDNQVYNWAIELKETNEIIGNISVIKLDNMNKSCRGLRREF